jgi:ubiquinone/menaquinone biosynthesis C-methylase UbiE
MPPARHAVVDRDGLRTGFLVYTRKAYAALPSLENPCILDIGCGTGIPTLELARVSNGEIVGMDIDMAQLAVFIRYIHEAGLQHRVSAVRCSMQQLAFSDGVFDIVWAEGSIAHIGFRQGLKRWWRYIRPDGYLVLHDNVDNVAGKRRWIDECGYLLTDHFVVDKEVWWDGYYKPLQEKIDMLKTISDKSDDIRKTVQALEHEIDQFHSNPVYHGSAFFIMQKDVQHEPEHE